MIFFNFISISISPREMYTTILTDYLKIRTMTEKYRTFKEKPQIHNPLIEEPCASTVVSVLVIEYWNLRFICNLVLEIWNFIDP